MSCTALPKARSSVRGRTLVCGRLATDAGATGRADGRPGGDGLTRVPLGDTRGLGAAPRVALSGLVDALAGADAVAGADGRPLAPGADAEQPASTASAAATA